MKLEDVAAEVERLRFLAPDEHKATVEEIAAELAKLQPLERPSDSDKHEAWARTIGARSADIERLGVLLRNANTTAATRRDMFPRELGRLRQHACKLTEGM